MSLLLALQSSGQFLVRSVTENITVTDSALRYSLAFRSQQDTAPVDDSLAASMILLRAVALAIGVADVFSVLAIRQRILSESATLIDGLVRSAIGERKSHDDIDLSESALSFAEDFRSRPDSAAVSDGISVSILRAGSQIYDRTIRDSTDIYDLIGSQATGVVVNSIPARTPGMFKNTLRHLRPKAEPAQDQIIIAVIEKAYIIDTGIEYYGPGEILNVSEEEEMLMNLLALAA